MKCIRISKENEIMIWRDKYHSFLEKIWGPNTVHKELHIKECRFYFKTGRGYVAYFHSFVNNNIKIRCVCHIANFDI